MAELVGRAGGICGGKGGSMHITSVEHGYYGSYAIIGAHLPIATGLAWPGLGEPDQPDLEERRGHGVLLR